MPLKAEDIAVGAITEMGPPDHHPFLIGTSPAMRSVEHLIIDIAPTSIPVIITGESGSGKDVVALEFHRRSSRKFFLKCSGNITAGQLAGQLLSPKNNAPMDGTRTFFLDEVDQLDSQSQNCLLRFFTECDRMRPDDSASPRIISTITQNLEQQMRSGRFDQRLYYRINGAYLHLPPLRDRDEDIPLLFQFFLRRYASLSDLPIPQFEPAMIKRLLRYEWPGNVRELENVARKAVVLQDLPLAFGEPSHSRSFALRKETPKAGSLKEAAREASRKVEKALILKTLKRTHWNRKRAALDLQISYKALLYKLKQIGLEESNNSQMLAGDTVEIGT